MACPLTLPPFLDTHYRISYNTQAMASLLGKASAVGGRAPAATNGRTTRCPWSHARPPPAPRATADRQQSAAGGCHDDHEEEKAGEALPPPHHVGPTTSRRAALATAAAAGLASLSSPAAAQAAPLPPNQLAARLVPASLATPAPLTARELAIVDAVARASRAVARVTDVGLTRAQAAASPAAAVVGVPQGNGSGVVIDSARRLLVTNYHVLAATLERLPSQPGTDESKQPRVALITLNDDGGGGDGGSDGGGGGGDERNGERDGASGAGVGGGGAGGAGGGRLRGRRTLDGFLVGYDRARDLAVLRIAPEGGGGGGSGGGGRGPPPPPLTALEAAPAASLRVGQAVVAIGSPFGFDGSVSAGVVSALGVAIPSLARPGATLTGCVAFDAAANPGSSGGALIDGRGLLVGVPTAIFTPTGVSAGQGFAIPAEGVVRAAQRLAAGETVRGAGLGVVVAGEAVKARLGLASVSGALIQAARPGGAAERAGLRATRREAGGLVAGDVILSVDGRLVGGATDLAAALAERSAGDAVRLAVARPARGGGVGAAEEVEAVLDDE